MKREITSGSRYSFREHVIANGTEWAVPAKSQGDRNSSGSTGGHCTAYSRDLRFKRSLRGGKEGEMLGVL